MVSKSVMQLTLTTHLFAQLLRVLDVQFVQRLDVLVHERDRNDEKLFVSMLGERFDRVVRLRLQPLDRTHFGLVDQPVGVRNFERVHHLNHGGAHLARVRIAGVDYLVE